MFELPRLLFVGGKGGVGKTTISSALASIFARGIDKVVQESVKESTHNTQKSLQESTQESSQKSTQKPTKTLLISTDPAHNLSDIFGVKLTNEVQNLDENLYGIEIDPKFEVRRYIDEVARDTKRFVSANSYAMLDNYYKSVAQSGVAQESALFDRLIRIITEPDSPWGRIVVDTAPTGHTLRLFTLPKTLKEWSKTLLSQQERGNKIENILGHLDESQESAPSNIASRLEERYLRYSAFHNRLKDPKECGIIFVLNPEHLAIEETARALYSLRHENLRAFALVVNKIFPPTNDPFFAKRYAMQEGYLSEIAERFTKEKILRIGLKSEDILGSANLQIIANELVRELSKV